jgi:hypothetical protein
MVTDPPDPGRCCLSVVVTYKQNGEVRVLSKTYGLYDAPYLQPQMIGRHTKSAIDETKCDLVDIIAVSHSLIY